MTKPIDFATDHEFPVELSDDELGPLGSGILHLKPGSWPQVTLPALGFAIPIADGSTRAILRAKTNDGLHALTLINCKKYFSSLVVDYVISGLVDDAFKGFEVRYRDITEWYCPWRALKRDDDLTYRMTFAPTHVDAVIDTRTESFRITTKLDTSVRTDGEDHIVHEHISFCFTATRGTFHITDIEEKALDLSRLLSILIAFPISIASIYAISDDDSLHSLVFATPKYLAKRPSGNDFPHRCFVDAGMLRKRWNTIFPHYFQSEYRTVSWARLAAMQRYEGFWEYKVIGYVSLLDKYISERYTATHQKKRISVHLSKRKKATFKNVISRLPLPLDIAQIESIIDSIAAHSIHTREPHFKEKYNAAIAATPNDVVKIINLSYVDFEQIKKIRDKVSHGEILDLTDETLRRVEPIMSKIALLMTYWFFVDIGLTDDDFINCLETGHSHLTLASEIDTTYLDRLRKPDSFFRVSERQFDKIQQAIKRYPILPCFTKTRRGSLTFSKKYSELYRTHGAKPNARSGITSHSAIFGVSPDSIKYYNPLYIEHEDKLLKPPMAFVIHL